MKLKQTRVEAEDPRLWLGGLSPAAQQCGRRFLEQCLPTDRAKFREYLEALARANAIPRGRLEQMEALAEANAQATHLLHDAPKWWRRR